MTRPSVSHAGPTLKICIAWSRPGRYIQKLCWWLAVSVASTLAATELDGFAFSIQDGAVTITGYTGPGGTVVVPSEVGAFPVTKIGSLAFYGHKGLTNLSIPGSVVSIGQNAFGSCSGLTNVTLGSGITVIKYGTFSDCWGLRELTIPGSVTSIEEKAFSGCTGLRSVTIPSSVTSIGSHVFENCFSMTDVVIPGSVTSIKEGAFSGCSRLTSVSISSGVTRIELDAFLNCRRLTGVTIPSSITFIHDLAFSGCAALKSIDVAAGNTSYSSLDGVLFDRAQATLITCPDGKTGSYTIPSTVSSIGVNAFGFCRGLTNVTIPSSVSKISYWAFAGCEGLSSVTIPDSVTSIESNAFIGCTGLSSVTIPRSVSFIGQGAFASPSIDRVVFLGDAPLTDPYPFAGTPTHFRAYWYAANHGFTQPFWQYGRSEALPDPGGELRTLLAWHEKNRFVLMVNAQAGWRYSLLRSTELSAPSPETIATYGPVALAGLLELIDPAPPTGQAFYRVVGTPPSP